MSSLEAPAKEDLEQKLLAFKHIEHYPAFFEELPFRVRQITDNCIHLRQLYDNVVERMRLTRKYMNDLEELQVQMTKKSLKQENQGSWNASQQDTYDKISQLGHKRFEASHMNYSQAPKQRSKFVQRIVEIDKEIDYQIEINVGIFLYQKKNAESAGDSFKYSTISNLEMLGIAQSKFEKAKEAIRHIGKGLNSYDWWK